MGACRYLNFGFTVKKIKASLRIRCHNTLSWLFLKNKAAPAQKKELPAISVPVIHLHFDCSVETKIRGLLLNLFPSQTKFSSFSFAGLNQRTLVLPRTALSYWNFIYRNKVPERFISSNKLHVNVTSNTSGIVAVKLLGEADPIYRLSSFQHPIWPPVMCSLHFQTHLLHIALSRTKKWER